VKRSVLKAAAATLFLAAAAHVNAQQLSVLSSFSPGIGGLEALGYDPVADRVWVYSGGTTLSHFSSAGDSRVILPSPGGSANDVDIEITPLAMTFAGMVLPAGTPLFINGEVDVAEVYALDKSSGAVMATLVTAFGSSHVVGGAYHPGRGTLFLVQDQLGGAKANYVAEIDPSSGSVLNEFSVASHFNVNFGDLDVGVASGNLFLVSDVENRILELTPTGAFVAYHALPSGVGSLSGLGLDDFSGAAWVSSTGDMVWQLGDAVAAIPEPQTYALLLAGLGLPGFTARRRLT